MSFIAAKHPVYNRGVPPDNFLDGIVDFARTSDYMGSGASIFLPNNRYDIYSLIEPALGPWTGIESRIAGMMEAMRVHGMFESSGIWTCGVDTTNANSVAHIEGQETGVFQVSWDSHHFDQSLEDCIDRYCDDSVPQCFIDTMKTNHLFACEYYARLVRFNIAWAGPLVHKLIVPYLSRAAMVEFQAAISD